ncbi:THAP domain-containing protein 11-like [Ornithodoros turicata]|uniref:THAP domain-containing protein 11-like n=1 Tax=Ornithodoros turicata TaxID=34597 RepID=UPI003139A2F7
MPVNCCVPLCTQHGRVDKAGCKVSYHRFPKDADLRKKWIVAIKRDEGPFFAVSDATKVCFHHFLETDFLANVANGHRHLQQFAVPSVFSFGETKPARKPPRQRTSPPMSASKRRKHDMASTQEVVEGVERQCTAETQEPSEEHGATESNEEDEPIGSFPGTLEELPTVAVTESVKECACTEK